jgi:hypothetical protein
MRKKVGLQIFVTIFLFVFLITLRIQQGQNLVLLLIFSLLAASSFSGGVALYQYRRENITSVGALASLENILVDHTASGITLWAFDFFEMRQHTIIVSGVIAAVKSLMIEMRKGNLKKMETEFGTFIKEDGTFLTVTCITSGNTASEENWIRQKLQTFLSIAEARHRNDLREWMGNTSIFGESFFQIISSLIDIPKALKLQKQRILKMEKKKEKLYGELKKLESKIDIIEKQFENGKISEEEFEIRKTRIKQEYKKIREYYINACFLLSRASCGLKEVNIKVCKKVERIKNTFLEIKSEIDELQVKKMEGIITQKDIRNKNKLQEKLITLIENLDRLN